MRGVTPILLLLLVAGHAIAGSGWASASHGEGGITVERVAGIALTILLVLGLTGFRRRRA